MKAPVAGQVQNLVNVVRPFFAGKEPAVIGAALADLMATFLAGHIGPDQDQLREEILQQQIQLVRTLIPINEAIHNDQTTRRGDYQSADRRPARGASRAERR